MNIDEPARASMAFVKKRFGNQTIIGAEVGVLHGQHALHILRNMPNLKLLYLVDPYQLYPEYLAADRPTLEDAKKPALQKLAPFKNRIRWISKKFEDCTIKDIDQPLDFIYIDGNHAYEYVKKDVVLATQFVKFGGVIAGHDAGSAGVDKAVIEYCKRKCISCSAILNTPFISSVGTKLGQGADWWFLNV